MIFVRDNDNNAEYELKPIGKRPFRLIFLKIRLRNEN